MSSAHKAAVQAGHIKYLSAQGLSQAQIVELLGCNPSTVWRVCNGQAHANVDVIEFVYNDKKALA